MIGLSIQQPWAWLIVNGYKDIENRDWQYPPKYRGPMLIHASKKFDMVGFNWVRKQFPEIPLPGRGSGDASRVELEFERGGFIGDCWFNDVVYFDSSPWFFGPLGFKLRRPRRIEFIPFRGNVGLMDIPKHVIDNIKYLGS